MKFESIGFIEEFHDNELHPGPPYMEPQKDIEEGKQLTWLLLIDSQGIGVTLTASLKLTKQFYHTVQYQGDS